MNMITHRHRHRHHQHIQNSNNYDEKMQRTQDYIEALEEERRKILVFQRELPLCLELVTQAIEARKQQLCGTISEYNFHGQSECSEQTSTDGPVLEEFIPLKRALSSDDEEDEESHKTKRSNNSSEGNEKAASKKLDWLRSVQLWNQTTDPPKKEDSPKKVSVVEVKRNGSGGAFHPFKREKNVGPNCKDSSRSEASKPCDGTTLVHHPVAEASSTVETGGSSGGGDGGGSGGNVGSSKKDEKEGQSSQRKSRRCWSPELHKRFLLALQQLGGAHVATPKQIRELMKVDGLTNDEVKSHLQKYRLHNRRPSPSSIHNNNNPQAPQFVVVGGIWVPPPEYATIAATTVSGEGSGGAKSNGIYAPIPTLPPRFQDPPTPVKQRQLQNDHECGSHSGGGIHSSSPASSSSTDTATT